MINPEKLHKKSTHLKNGQVTYVRQYRHCGKPSCTKCPHGPYWFAYWKDGGRTRSKYIGKTRPEELRESPERNFES